jgi:hypothetical protein
MYVFITLFGSVLRIHSLLISALGFANNNAKVNEGTTPKVCAIFAKTKGNWRDVIRKVCIRRLILDRFLEANRRPLLGVDSRKSSQGLCRQKSSESPRASQIGLHRQGISRRYSCVSREVLFTAPGQ